MIHPTAIVESSHVDPSTNVWAFAHILPGARIGRNGNIGDHVYIEGEAVIGDNVTIKNGVSVWDGITIEDGVFVGPAVVFTNDLRPRSPRLPMAEARYSTPESWRVPTRLGYGCSIGGGAVLVAGAHVGCFAMVGAGAVVTRPVEPFALVIGQPARRVGFVCQCGHKLGERWDLADCRACGMTGAQRRRWLEAHGQTA
ncbi:MAG: N-acetyltransferase [Planctomycetota bacterium]|nr:MAG: N-acetyltransferase [Planctomycetota bacterium]